MMRRRCQESFSPLDLAIRTIRIETECLELPAPFGRQIAEPLDADPAGQATFYSPWN
jgi:hypothetical protein